jgi:uncharacterized protein YdcH (DUF465 family)
MKSLTGPGLRPRDLPQQWRCFMEKKEYELLETLAPEHPELKALWDDHILYEKQLEKLESKTYRTPAEEQQMRQLKKQKLDGKTRLVALIHEYATKEG